MGQGQDRIASSLLELQPTAIIELFLLYFNTVDSPNAFIAFHGGSVYNKGIVWQGIEYLPIPVETDGFEVTANGQLPRPKMRISNKDYFATDLLIRNDDLQFAKIIRKRTFVKFLDDANFDGGNPWSQADASAEISNDTFVVGQKTAENKSFIELELTSPLDLENFEVNNRLIMARYCSWHYRGNGCNYNGIPIATEEGESLTVGDPVAWYENSKSNMASFKWSSATTKQYNVGDAVYIENTKIIINKPNSSQQEFAKIWYVCQQQHFSSESKIPDKNPSLWKRDGCNKKLDGCKRRFGSGVIEFNESFVSRTATFVDFTSRANSRFNNIAPLSTISATTSAANTSPQSLIDYRSGANSVWQATNKTTVVTLEWPTPRNISAIDIYDPPTNSNINTASIRYFDINNTQISSGRMSVATNGTVSHTGFSDRLVKKIEISGVNPYGNTSLSEIAVFETTPPAFYYRDQEAIPLHRNNFFQIAMWISGVNRSNYYSDYLSIFHNILSNARHSGLNLHVYRDELRLDFATIVGSQPPIKRTLSIPWKNDDLKPIHLICSGGTGANSAGYIELTDGEEMSRFILSGSTGEYFKFKHPSHQYGIISNNNTRLRFGLNDWMFPSTDSTFSPFDQSNYQSDFIERNLEIISPMKFGPIAIWTGASGVTNRIVESSQSVYKDYSDFSARSSNTFGLLGWWEMATGNGTTNILAQNNSSKILYITGDENQLSKYNTSSTSLVTKTEILNISKENTTLPFGGFPGTEKYG